MMWNNRKGGTVMYLNWRVMFKDRNQEVCSGGWKRLWRGPYKWNPLLWLWSKKNGGSDSIFIIHRGQLEILGDSRRKWTPPWIQYFSTQGQATPSGTSLVDLRVSRSTSPVHSRWTFLNCTYQNARWVKGWIFELEKWDLEIHPLTKPHLQERNSRTEKEHLWQYPY